jgi:hypothetical protein
MENIEIKKFYRYKIENYALMSTSDDYYSRPSYSIPNSTLVLEEYNLYKETPKGYWIHRGMWGVHKIRSDCKWIPKDSKRRFAYPTKKEALNSFIIRQKYKIKILSYQVENSKSGILLAEREIVKLERSDVV